MKLRIAPLVVLLTSVAAPALAQTCTEPTEANGQILFAADRESASTIFTDFFASAGGGDPDTVVVTCAASFDVARADGFTIFSADIRGFANLETGQVAELANVGGSVVFRQEGPFQADIIAADSYGVAPGESLDVALRLVLAANGGPAAFASVDSLDIQRAGFVSTAAVQGSFDELARQRAATAAHIYADADLLLGFLQPIEGENGISAIGAVGSALVGATGRFNFGEGLSAHGGIAYFDQSTGADASGVLLAGSLRYVEPETDPLRVFAEAGVWGSPDLHLNFSRSFEQQRFVTGTGFVTDTITAGAAPAGSLIGIYGRIGAIYDFNATNELAFSATIGRDWLSVDGWTENAGGSLFPATFGDTTSASNFAKATLAWTSELTPQLDLTASVAVGQTFGSSHDVSGTLQFGNASAGITGSIGDFTFVEYGARVGYAVTDQLTIDGFVAGITGQGIGTHIQVGAGVSFAF